MRLSIVKAYKSRYKLLEQSGDWQIAILSRFSVQNQKIIRIYVVKTLVPHSTLFQTSTFIFHD
jgi:hypothetical protein